MNRIFFLSLLGFLFFISACRTNSGLITITETNFTDEINVNENLEFSFNRDIVPDSMLNIWIREPLLLFEPKMRGEFRWEEKNLLVFSPSKDFKINSAYTVRLNEPLSKALGKGFALDSQLELKFTTPKVKLESADLSWYLKSANPDDASLTANLTFNHEVKPNTFNGKIKAKIDGKSVEPKISNSNISKVLTLRIPASADMKNAKKFTVDILQGFEVLNSENNLPVNLNTTIDVPSPNQLVFSNATANHNGAYGELIVYSNQQIESINLRSYLTIEPKVTFEAEATSSGLTVSSNDFDIDKVYSITISEDLKGIYGGNLKAEYTTDFSFGKLKPTINFPDDRSEFLSSAGAKNIPVQIVSVPEIQVTITKIFDNNLINFFRTGKDSYWSEEYIEEDDYWEYYDYYKYNTRDFGKVVYDEVIQTKELESAGKVKLINMNFKDRLPQYEGLYVVEVRDLDKKFLTDSKIVSVSDLGLLVKEGKDKVHVFVNSINSATPVGGTTVTIIDRTNQKLLKRPTDGDGVAIFDKKEFGIPDAEVYMAFAQSANDFNYLVLNRTRQNTSRFEVGGLRNHYSNYHAYLYGERELYRPGETINFSGIVRTTDWKNPGSIPFTVKCITPTGKEYKTIRKVLNNQGAFETSVDIPATSSTGSYVMELYTGNDILVNTKSIKVEEFMPDRIKVETEINKKDYSPGETVEVNIEAVNYFGPPAKNRNFEVDLSLNRTSYSPKDFRNYYFYIDNNQNLDRQLEEGKTEEDGTASVSFKIPSYYSDMGKLRGRVVTTVFDESGRPVARSKSFDVYTQDVYFGVKNFDTYLQTDVPLDFQFVALNKDSEVLSDQKMQVKVQRTYYRTVLEKDGRGRYRYRSNRQVETVVDKVITVNGKNTKFTFIPKESGRYDLIFGEPGNDYQVSKRFSAYGRGDTQYTSFDVDREGRIAIERDKDEYRVGDQARLLLRTPFAGRVLISVERDGIIKHFYTNTDKKSAEVILDITEEMTPNAYISATLIKANQDQSTPLTVAYGYENLKVIDGAKEIPLQIITASKIRSKKKHTVTIEAAPNTEVTVAAVDEGILAITNHQSPDPFSFFYQKRALEVGSYDLYPYLFPEIGNQGLLRGGDEGGSMDKRSVGFGDKRVKLVSFWSGIQKTDASGKYEFEIDVPQFSGDLRIMAVAYENDKFGAASSNMKVADPVVVSTGLPRFLSPNDQLSIPVMLSNTTSNNMTGSVKITTEGPVSINGEREQTVELKANDEYQVLYNADVKPELGTAKIKVEINNGKETFTEEQEIMVRPASPLQKKSGAGTIEANNTESLNFASEFIPSSIDGTLQLSHSPVAEFGDKLDYLLRYPHGCLEQTISKSFPLVYIEDLLKDMNVDTRSNEKLDPYYLVQEGIYKIQTMQLSNGGLTYWKSPRSKVTWWGSAYAAHFLVEAKKAGYDVNDRVLNKLLKYLREQIKTKETTAYFYHGSIEKEYVRREIPYSLFVLALNGDPDIASMNYYKSNPELLSLDSRYMIGAAYGVLGDMDRFSKMIPGSFTGDKPIGEMDGSFSSYLRDMALSLYVLVESDPDNAQIPAIAKKLSEEFKGQRYFNTQEAAYTLLALGKLSQQIKNNNVSAVVKKNGQTLANFNGKSDVFIDYNLLKDGDVSIETKGNGRLYYFWQLEGLTTSNEVEERDNFLEVRKNFFDRDGKSIDIDQVEQNDLIVVRLSLRSKDKQVKNVVVTDILPAGFEIENPRLSDGVGQDWQTNRGSYDFIDFRDDRVNIFTTARPNKNNYYHFYYTVRAVSKGKYVMGPASADAMYNGEYYSYNGGRTIEIK